MQALAQKLASTEDLCISRFILSIGVSVPNFNLPNLRPTDASVNFSVDVQGAPTGIIFKWEDKKRFVPSFGAIPSTLSFDESAWRELLDGFIEAINHKTMDMNGVIWRAMAIRFTNIE